MVEFGRGVAKEKNMRTLRTECYLIIYWGGHISKDGARRKDSNSCATIPSD